MHNIESDVLTSPTRRAIMELLLEAGNARPAPRATMRRGGASARARRQLRSACT